MFFRPLTLALLLGVALATTTSNAANTKPTIKQPPSTKKKGHVHVHSGVIEKVSVSESKSGSHGGSLTIKEHHHKKKGATTAKSGESKEETFKIEKHTKVERHGKPAKLEDLKKGEHVIVHSKDKVAEKIDIVHHKHKKKGKKNAKSTISPTTK